LSEMLANSLDQKVGISLLFSLLSPARIPVFFTPGLNLNPLRRYKSSTATDRLPSWHIDACTRVLYARYYPTEYCNLAPFLFS